MISDPASIIAIYAIGCATRYCYGSPSMLVVCEWPGREYRLRSALAELDGGKAVNKQLASHRGRSKLSDGQ